MAKDLIFVDLDRVQRLAQLLAGIVKTFDAEILCGPSTGGLIVAQWTAHELGRLAVFTEHDPAHKKSEIRGRFGLHRGYDKLVRGKRVLVVDDVVNTGLSVSQTADAVTRCRRGCRRGRLPGRSRQRGRCRHRRAGVRVPVGIRYPELESRRVPAV